MYLIKNFIFEKNRDLLNLKTRFENDFTVGMPYQNYLSNLLFSLRIENRNTCENTLLLLPFLVEV